MTTDSLVSPAAETRESVAEQRPAAKGHRASRPVQRAVSLTLLLPPLAAGVALAMHWRIPSRQTDLPTHLYPLLLEVLLMGGIAFAILQSTWPRSRRVVRASQSAGAHENASAGHSIVDRVVSRVLDWVKPNAPLIAAAIMLLSAWDLLTLKLALVPLPYFPGPDMVLQQLRDDWALIFNCTWHSLLLLLSGFALGAIVGITSGVLIGWSSAWRYWGMPVLKVLGPIPATAFIPVALMLFPNAFMSALALIALAVWFPVTMLTTAGVANVRVSLLDVARTLGARPSFLIFRVAIPAALPNIFVGLFMGLGSSFLTLIVAETVGVTSGLGWYIKWAQGWADYPKVYAALAIMAVFFSGIMTLLFKVRDRVLVYQRGTIKW